MKATSFMKLAAACSKTVVFGRKDHLIGSVIITDRCNLSCRHCAVHNITSVIYPYQQVRRDIQKLYDQGVRILFFFGGEPFLWSDSGRTLRNFADEAKDMGFVLVSAVTNGTFPIDLPGADMVLVSLDGGREKHNEIRGETYDTVIENIRGSASPNICLYMAINQINKGEIAEVCRIAVEEDNVCAVSFNFHTPYPGTEELSLSQNEKALCLKEIESMMDSGIPVLNLRSAFPYIARNDFPVPCYQCTIIEDGRQFVCGRCIEIPDLCSKCGYMFAAEYSLVFQGKLKVIFDMMRTYMKFI